MGKLSIKLKVIIKIAYSCISFSEDRKKMKEEADATVELLGKVLELKR